MQKPVDILLVDDEERNLDALESSLADPGYRLLRAGDADQALRLLLDHEVAVIVLDIKLPGVSGFELARMIKNTKRFRETPIVFLTAYLVDDQDMVAGYGAGGVDYLTKPLNPAILRQKVAVFADLYRKTRELAAVNAELARVNERLEERVSERTAELQRSEAALRAAASQKDEFLAVLAHELRNPLAPLRTGLDLIRRQQEKGAVPASLTRTLGAMNRQVDHLVRLIDDLLDVSRISRGLLELKREPVELGTIAASAVESARPWLERKNQRVTVELASEVRVSADPTRVAQILTNLLHNAAKFTPAGGFIRMELAARDGQAVLRLVDSGSGIRKDQLERVFDMFVRIERPGVTAEPGLGIGLALARRLSHMHGGELSVASEGEGKGTTFTLSLPLLEAVRAVSETDERPEAPLPGDCLDVVIVEDNEDIAEVLFDWLGELGHRVRVAGTGAAGLALIRDSRPELVLCDLGLPDFHGAEVCRQVRASAERQPLMVALTGWGREDDLRLTREAGFDHHLVKPVSPEALEAIIDEACKKRGRGSASQGDRLTASTPP